MAEGWRSHLTLQSQHRGTLNESTNVGVEIGRSRLGGAELCVGESMVTRDDGDTMITQVRALLKEVKPYVLLDCIQ